MVNLPILRHKDFLYARMRGLIWQSQGLAFPNTIEAKTGKAIARFLEAEPTEVPFVIDCQGINQIDDHALESWNASVALRRQIVLINIQPIYEMLARLHELPKSCDENSLAVIGKDRMDLTKARELLHKAKEFEQAHISNIVKLAFLPFPQPRRLASTPLLAPGVFNAAGLISDPTKFLWLALLMAEKLTNLLANADTQRELAPASELRLLAVSLRASPFAVAIALLTSQNVEIVDHMGPIQKILEEHGLQQPPGRVRYIYVADFVCGGTELRVAQTYAHTRGSYVEHALAIGSYREPKEYGTQTCVHPLVTLSAVCPKMTIEL